MFVHARACSFARVIDALIPLHGNDFSPKQHLDTQRHSPIMSSLVDAVINSDFFQPDNAATDQQQRQKRDDRRRYQRGPSRPRSSSRPRGPPSESAGARSDVDGFLDDEIAQPPVRRNNGPRADVPKVVDKIGELMVRRFEEFLET